MSPRIALATLALGTALTTVPAIAQNYGSSDNPAQQYKYQIGRPVNDGGMGYGAQSTSATPERTGSAENQQAGRTGAYQPQAGPDYYNYAGGPGLTPTAGADAGAIGWCRVHFRSFDPATGTFLGFDGIRHNCP